MNHFDTTIQIFVTRITCGPLMHHAIRSRFAPQVLAMIRRFPAPACTLTFLPCFELIAQFDALPTLARSATHTM